MEVHRAAGGSGPAGDLPHQALSSQLGEIVCDIDVHRLSPRVIELAKTRILEGLAVAFGGSGFGWSQTAINSVQTGVGEGTIVGSASRASFDDACMVNGILCHSYSQQDTGIAGHPSAIVIPAVMAAGEEIGASGGEVLAGIVAGYEIAGRIGEGHTVEFRRRGLRGVPAVGPLAASSAAARTYGLGPEQVSNALNLAANFAGGIYQGHQDGTMEGSFQAGMAARNGLLAARLAKAGVETAPSTLEGPKGYFQTLSGSTDGMKRVVAGLGGRHYIERVFSKPYVGCYLNQQLMDMALSAGRAGGRGRKVDRARATMDAADLLIPGLDRKPPFRSMLQAYMSVSFCVAAGLLDRPLDSPTYFATQYADREVASLAGRVEVAAEADRPHPRLDVLFTDGSALSIDEDRSSIGTATMDRAASRFRRHAAPILGASAEAVVETVAQLDRIADVRALTRGLMAP